MKRKLLILAAGVLVVGFVVVLDDPCWWLWLPWSLLDYLLPGEHFTYWTAGSEY